MSAADSFMSILVALDARVNAHARAMALLHERAMASGVSIPDLLPCGVCDEARRREMAIAGARRIWFAERVPAGVLSNRGNRIAVLEPHDLRRVLAARALWQARDAVRRCVDGRRRRLWEHSVGRYALDLLEMQAGGSDDAVEAPADVTVGALARRGWRIARRNGVCSSATLFNMVELSLAFSEGGRAWKAVRVPRPHADRRARPTGRDGLVPDGRRTSAQVGHRETDPFFCSAGILFPEFQWLFG